VRPIPSLVAVVAICAAGCAAGERPPPDPAPAIIVDADADGAVLFDGQQRAYLGVHRDGSLAWRVPAGPHTPTPSGCLAHCPDAALSGSAASANSASVPDPAPMFIVAGQQRALDVPGVKRNVLTAAGPADYVLSTGDGSGQWWLEIHAGETVVRRVPVDGFHTSWQESVDRRHALAITTAATGRHAAQWFERGAGGWQPTAPSLPVAGATSCLQPDGDHALLIGQRPTILERGGGQADVTDLELAGTCALARTGGIVADLSQGTDGLRSDIRVFAGDRRTTWHRAAAGEISVSADPTSTRVSYTSGGALHEFDAGSGAELRSLPGVRAARYNGTGDLVVWSTEGIRWLD